MAKPFQFRRCLWMAVVPVAGIAISVGWYLWRPRPPQPVTGTVTGTITLDGLPLWGAEVFFVPVAGSGGRTACGTTDRFGAFTLETHMGGSRFVAGAMPGSYKVSVEQVKITPINYPPPDFNGTLMCDCIVDRISPDKYASADTSELAAEVTLYGPNIFTFNLTTP